MSITFLRAEDSMGVLRPVHPTEVGQRVMVTGAGWGAPAYLAGYRATGTVTRILRNRMEVTLDRGCHHDLETVRTRPVCLQVLATERDA